MNSKFDKFLLIIVSIGLGCVTDMLLFNFFFPHGASLDEMGYGFLYLIVSIASIPVYYSLLRKIFNK